MSVEQVDRRILTVRLVEVNPSEVLTLIGHGSMSMRAPLSSQHI